MSIRFTFWIMVGIVAISGLSQGMLLPAIAMIFEQEGVSSHAHQLKNENKMNFRSNKLKNT